MHLSLYLFSFSTIVAQHLTKAVRVALGVKDEVYAAYKLKTLSDHKGEMQSWIKEVWKRVRSVKSE